MKAGMLRIIIKDGGKNMKKLLTVLLAAVLVLGLFGTTAFAEEAAIPEDLIAAAQEEGT